MESVVYQRKQNFTYSDLDAEDHLFPSSLLQAFQNVAGEHADLLGVGYLDMLAKDYIWVIDKTRYTILKPERMKDITQIRTWPQPSKTIEFNREYLLLADDGEEIVRSTSKWCVVNIKTRRLVRIRDLAMPKEGYLAKTCYDFPYEILKPEDCLQTEPVLTKTVRFSDLDHNKHMNNTNYADLALDTLKMVKPEAILKDMQINFLKECQPGDILTTFIKELENNTYLVVGRKNTEENSFSALLRC